MGVTPFVLKSNRRHDLFLVFLINAKRRSVNLASIFITLIKAFSGPTPTHFESVKRLTGSSPIVTGPRKKERGDY